MLPRPDLAIVIVSYNVRDYLVACLRSLPAAADGLAVEIVVIDNASCDGSADLVATEFPAVRVIRNRENAGFARAANQGLALAERAVAPFALLLNPDTVVPPHALVRLVEVANACPEAGLVAPTLDDPVSGAARSSLRRFPSWRDTFSHYTFAKGLLRHVPPPDLTPLVDRPTTAGWLSGACLLIRLDILRTVGLLDAGYFMWCEDIDYCRRATLAGWSLLQTSAAVVHHHEGKSVSQEAPSDVRLQQLQSVFRYLDKAFPRRSRFLKPLFKLCFLGTIAGRFFGTGAKVLVYWLLGSSTKTERHWQRWKRDVVFLWQFGVTFLFVL